MSSQETSGSWEDDLTEEERISLCVEMSLLDAPTTKPFSRAVGTSMRQARLASRRDAQADAAEARVRAAQVRGRPFSTPTRSDSKRPRQEKAEPRKIIDLRDSDSDDRPQASEANTAGASTSTSSSGLASARSIAHGSSDVDKQTSVRGVRLSEPASVRATAGAGAAAAAAVHVDTVAAGVSGAPGYDATASLAESFRSWLAGRTPLPGAVRMTAGRIEILRDDATDGSAQSEYLMHMRKLTVLVQESEADIARVLDEHDRLGMHTGTANGHVFSAEQIVARQYWEAGHSMILFGGQGSGKTTTMFTLAKSEDPSKEWVTSNMHAQCDKLRRELIASGASEALQRRVGTRAASFQTGGSIFDRVMVKGIKEGSLTKVLTELAKSNAEELTMNGRLASGSAKILNDEFLQWPVGMPTYMLNFVNAARGEQCSKIRKIISAADGHGQLRMQAELEALLKPVQFLFAGDQKQPAFIPPRELDEAVKPLKPLEEFPFEDGSLFEIEGIKVVYYATSHRQKGAFATANKEWSLGIVTDDGWRMAFAVAL